MRRREVLGLGLSGAVATLFAGHPTPAQAGVALKVFKDEGMVAVPLPGVGPDGVVPVNPAPLDAANLQSDLIRDLYRSCIGRGKAGDAIEVIQPLFQQLLARQADAASGPGVSTLVLVADTFAPDISHESQTYFLTVAGKTYSNNPKKHTLRKVGHGYTIRISHTPAPSDDELDGFLFVAVVRLIQYPDRGLVILGVIDSELAANLEANGITNTDANGTEVTIPYSLNIQGAKSGNHRANNKSFQVLYYAAADVYGVAAPADLADEAQSFLEDVAGPNPT